MGANRKHICSFVNSKASVKTARGNSISYSWLCLGKKEKYLRK